jgi:hypothetical protein
MIISQDETMECIQSIDRSTERERLCWWSEDAIQSHINVKYVIQVYAQR